MSNVLIPLKEATAFAMSTIATATDEDRNIFGAWICESIKIIGPNRQWLQECILYPEDGSMRKPREMSNVVDIALYDSSNCELIFTYHPDTPSRIHIDRFQIHDITVQNQAFNRIDLSEDAFYFNLGDPQNRVSYAKIRYFAIPTDGNGDLLIPDLYRLPLAIFCRYMWSMRKNDNRSEIDQNYSMWLKESDRVRGRMKMPNQLEARAIASAWLNLFNTAKLFPNF